MLKRKLVVLGLVTALAATGALAVAGPAGAQGGRRFQIALSGANEVPINPHGAADSGSVMLTLNQGRGEICWTFGELTLTAGEPLPFAGHIHEAPAGDAGGVVVTLFDPTTGTTPTSYPSDTVCVAADSELIKEIRKNPESYYVNLHNTTHPAGVVRGQLG